MHAIRTLAPTLLLALGLAGRAADAQIAQFSLNFEEIKIQHATGASHELDFRTELTLGADGSARAVLRTHKATDVTLKRGVFFPADELAQTSLEMALESTGGALGAFGTLQVDAAHTTGGVGGHVRVFSGQTAQLEPTNDVEVLVPRVARDSRVELRFTPTRGARLHGQPAALFNRPGIGQELVALLPMPVADSGIKVYVDVVYNHTAQSATVMLRSEAQAN